MEIDIDWDSSVDSAPAGFKTAVMTAVQYLDNLFTNPVTITIAVGYGEVAGQALPSGDLSASEAASDVVESYSAVRNALIAEGAPGASTLPAASPDQGTLLIPIAEAVGLGLSPSNGSVDGYIGISSSYTFSYANGTAPPAGEYYLIGAVEHEITEDMGRVSFVDYQPNDYSAMDLFRYSSPGVRDLADGGSGSTAYFSIDNGTTNLGSWNNNPGNGDLGDWYPSGPAPGGDDAFNDYASPGVVNVMSPSDITLMEALGWTAATADPGPTAGNGAVTVGHGETVTLTALIDGLVTPGLAGDTETLTGVSAAYGTAVLGSGQTVTYTAPAGGSDTISYTVADQNGDTAGGQVAVTVDPGPTAANGALTVGHGETVTLTALIDGLITPGLAGDTETVTGLSAAYGTAVLGSGQAVTYTAPASGPDTISYTAADEYGDTAGGQVAVSVDPGPAAGNTAVTVGHGETVTLTALIDGLVTPGLAGDTETLTGVSAAYGTALLGSGQAVTYTAPASGPDTVSYTVADQYGDTAGGQVAVSVDPGPTAANGALTVGHGETVTLTALIDGLVTPGLAGDTETVTGVSAAYGSAVLGSGQAVTYTAPASGPDTISYTVDDEYGDTAGGHIAVTVDSGPTAGDGAVTVGHGQTVTLTALIDGLVTPGVGGDTETLTGVGAAYGSAVLGSGEAVTYTAPASGPDTISYTVDDEYGDTAGGHIAVTVDSGPTAGDGAVTVGHGQTVTLTALIDGLVTPGVGGDTETLTGVGAAYGSAVLGSGEAVIYTAPASGPDTVSYTVADQYGDTASGQVAVTVDPGQYISSGGSAVGTVVGGGDFLIVSNGGYAQSTTVSSGGSVIVSSGGVASSTTVSAGGAVTVAPGGVAVGTTLGSGSEFIVSGGEADSTTIGSGGTQYVGSGGTADNSVIGGGTLELGVGGSLGSDPIEFGAGGGTLRLDETVMPSNTIGGFGSGDTIDLAGAAFDSGGAVTVLSGNILQVTENGRTYDLRLDPTQDLAGVQFTVSPDGGGGADITMASDTVSGGRVVYVSSGQTSGGVTVLSGGELIVLSGGIASGAVVSSGAIEMLQGSGGFAVIGSTAQEYVLAGGTATGTMILSGGDEFVESGGAAGGTVADGGSQVVYGSAGGTVLNSGSYLYLESGFAADTVVSSGVAVIYGAESGTTDYGGGYDFVFAGGTATGTTLSGGEEYVETGAGATGTVVEDGGAQVLYGAAVSTTLDSGTSAYLEPGSIAGGVAVDGALAVIYGTVSAVTVAGGGYDYVEPGGTVFGTVLNGGDEYVESGAAANGTVIASGAEVIYGTTTGTVIDGGGYEYVYPGGTASGTIVNSGVESIFTLAVGTIVNSGGADFVNDGSASGTIVAGGDEFVEFATSAVGTLVSGAGGGQFVYGTATDTTLASGGEEVVEVGGVAGATTVESGGYEYVASGGTAAGATIGGGTLELTSGAIAAATIAFAGGGELKLDDAPGFAGTVAGFGLPDQIDLADISFGAGTIFGFQEAGGGTSGTLTVGDGTNTATLTLLGQYLASQFAIAGDGNGGTLVTDPPPGAAAELAPNPLAIPRYG